jgi:cysteine-rich repeat protein
MPRRPRPLGRAPLLAAALIAACRFESAGLGDEGPGPADDTTVADPLGTTVASSSTSSADSDIGDISGDDSDISGDDSDSGAAPGCGNGVLDPGEQCDGGEGCSPACAPHVCGDGYIGPGEQCDDAGANGDDQSCTSACQVAACGDGLVGPDEACDDGNNSNTDACLVGCILAGCGDGFQHVDVENCDAGADNGAYDGVCNATCDGPGPSCGDGVWDQPFELCDGDGAPSGTDCESGCKPVCEFAKYDCNGDLADGCQALLSDKHNCGACGKKCPNFCVLGTCY